jgi:pyridoxine 5-phosphate synthase
MAKAITSVVARVARDLGDRLGMARVVSAVAAQFNAACGVLGDRAAESGPPLLCYRRPVMRLHVNIDHVATLRNARGTAYPDPVEAARLCLEAGAHGITAHLREDRRHIRDADVERLRAALRSTFNLEMAATDEMVAIARKVTPDVVTLVPERREEQTTEGGLEVVKAAPSLRAQIDQLRAADIKVSLFIAPELAQVEASHALGVEQIELHTGEYAHAAFGSAAEERELARLAAASKRGRELGLEIAAGHGLTTKNVPALVAIPEVVELNIGHALVSDAVFLGLPGAVRAMLAAIGKGRAPR